MKVTIERLGQQGDGIAEGPLFVPRTLPGEVVEGTPEGDRLTGVKIVTPAAERIAPPCPHFRQCGGCAMQHVADDFVADWKIGIVRQALEARELPAPITGIATSPPRSRRRATLHGIRTKKGGLVGFHAKGSGQITSIPSCLLLTPELMDALPMLEGFVPLAASRKSEIALTVTQTRGGLDLAISGARPLDDALRAELAARVETTGLARLAWNGEVLAERSAPEVKFGRARVVPPSGAFLQATRQGEDALIAAVRLAVGDAARICDLFAGCGTFALPLAEDAQVLAVEGDAAMTAALERGWREAQGLKTVRTLTRDLFRRPLLHDELKGFDAVVIDPPRAGAEAQIAALADAAVPVIAAVSCNPVSFARDAATLVAAGYTLDWVRVVDQFRWSSHVELAARFSRHA